MDTSYVFSSPVETATADAAYFTLSSVWAYLNWMLDLTKDNDDAKELVANLKRGFVLECSASAHSLSVSYAAKWRALHKVDSDGIGCEFGAEIDLK